MLKLKKYIIMDKAEDAGLDSMGALAEKLNISPQWLSMILNNSATPSVTLLVQLCQVLGCRIDDIAEYPAAELATVYGRKEVRVWP